MIRYSSNADSEEAPGQGSVDHVDRLKAAADLRRERAERRFERNIRQFWQPTLGDIQEWLDEDKAERERGYRREGAVLRARRREREARDIASGRMVVIGGNADTGEMTLAKLYESEPRSE